jgi:hypothetical protein
MRAQTCCAVILFLQLADHARAETSCIDPAQLAHSTVSITRYFEEAERTGRSDLAGIQGTGWFHSPTTIVTVEHVATAMGLSKQEWKLLHIRDGSDIQQISARILRFAGGRFERLAVLELQTATPAARSAEIRTSPLLPEDRVLAIAYLQDDQRSVSGRFVEYGSDGRLAGAALLEMYDGNNRLAIDHGASGAPVFDCKGQITAVVSTVITQILQTPFGAKRISTSWGTPNVVSVPVRQLVDSFTPSERAER